MHSCVVLEYFLATLDFYSVSPGNESIDQTRNAMESWSNQKETAANVEGGHTHQAMN